jgi:phosphoglycerate dehydrogenase-like enzyme
MKVLVYISWAVRAWRIPNEQVARLRERFPEITFVHAEHEADALDGIVDADIAFSSRLTPEMVERAERLRWVHSGAAAVGGLLPLAELGRRDIRVSNSRGVQAIPMAEQVMCGLLVLARRMDLTLAAQREKRWIQEQLCNSDWPWMLHGRSMTIIGLGTIGTEVARRANAFGIRVTAVRRRPEEPKPAYVERVVGPGALPDALKGCDILVISAPFVAGTNRIIGREQITMMNDGAILVNVARGQIVDETAMIDALRNGKLGGAVLDVFDKEPLDESSPLWTLPNVVISPHSSGFRKSHWDEVIDLFSTNLQRYRRGESLLNPVDCEAGY